MTVKRDAVIQVYVSQEEKTLIEEAAAHDGLSAAAYARQVLLAEARKVIQEAAPRKSRMVKS